MNGPRRPTQSSDLAIDHPGQASKGVRMAGSASAGCGLSRDIAGSEGAYDWPGREFGIRQPYPTETPLSWCEVKHFLNNGAMQ